MSERKFAADRVGVVAVGIEAYKFSNKNRNLNGPARHAVEFVKLAKEAGVTMDKVRVFLSVGDEVSMDKVLGELSGKVRVCNADCELEQFLDKELQGLDCDLLYFYWCGHGAVHELDRRLFYADAGDIRYNNLDVSQLLHYLRTDRFKHTAQVGFVDACAERVGQQAARLDGPTPLLAGKDLMLVPRSQFFYYAAAPWNTAQSESGTVYFSRAVLEVLGVDPKQLLQPRPDLWKDAIAAKFKERWPEEAEDFQPVSFLEFADGHERSTVLVKGFSTADQDEIRRAAELRGWSLELTSKVVKELADVLGRRDADFCETLYVRFGEITNLAIVTTGSPAVRLLCGAMVERKLEVFLEALRGLSKESAGAQAFERLCQNADKAADLRRKAESIGLALAKWQAIYKEWMDRDVAVPQTLELLLFESLNSYATEDGAGIVYLAERAYLETSKGWRFRDYCRHGWPEAVPNAMARLESRRQGNQNYIILELSRPRSEKVNAGLLVVDRAWFQAAGDPQPRQADAQVVADRQRKKNNLGERIYSVAEKLCFEHFKHVEDPLIVLEVIVDAPLLLCDPDIFKYSGGDLLARYNVALRWRARLDPGEDELAAQESWEKLAGRTCARVLPTDKVTCGWLGWDEENMDVRVRDHIQEAVRCANPRSLLVGLQPDGDFRKLTSVLSASGAPFACWHNSGFKGAAADIPALLGQTILEELPHALRKARLDRNGLKDLTLLYDDPQRDPYQNES